MREDENFAGPLVGMRIVSQDLADELAVHLAFLIAHFLVANRNSHVAHTAQQFVNHRQHCLTTGSAGVLDRLDRFALQSGDRGYQARQQALLVQGKVASRADRPGVDDRRGNFDLLTNAGDRIGQNLRHGHIHELAKLGLVVGGDINALVHDFLPVPLSRKPLRSATASRSWQPAGSRFANISFITLALRPYVIQITFSKKAAATSCCWNKSGSSPNPMTLASASIRNFSSHNLVHITPHPGFSRFDGPYQWMLGFVIVLGGMFVLGRVAEPDMSAFQAQPQVYPRVSQFDALLTNVNFGVRNLDLVEMSACVRHLVPPDPPQRSRALRSHFASVAAAS